MSRRCEHTSFYLAGVKIHSGEGVALTPDGPLKVVCRKAKPGEINVQELPTGTPVEVPCMGIFAFDATAWRGKAGRRVDVLERSQKLNNAVKWSYLRRAAASRDDLATMQGVLDMAMTGSPLPSKTLASMMRRSPQRIGPVIDAALTQESMVYALSRACGGIDDPVQLWHLAATRAEDYSSSSLVGGALARLAQLGFHAEVEKFIAAKIAGSNEPDQGAPLHGWRFENALAHMPPQRVARFVKQMVTEFPSNSTVSMGFHAANIVTERSRAAGDEFTLALTTALKEVDTSSWDHELVKSLVWCIEHPQSWVPFIYHSDLDPERWVGVDDEDLLSTYVSSATNLGGSDLYAALEISRRPGLIDRLPSDRSLRWVHLISETREVSDAEILNGFWQMPYRKLVAESASAATLHWIVQDFNEHPSVLMTALERIGDPRLYQKHLTSLATEDLRRRHVLECMPLESLRELVTLCSSNHSGNELVWEVATHRGAITTEAALGSRFITARAAAAAQTTDQALLSKALRDPSLRVRRAAVFHARDINALRDLQLELADITDEPKPSSSSWMLSPGSLKDTVATRLQQLTYLELIEVSLQRNEIEVARAALQQLTARDLLRYLTRYTDLLPYVAERLESSTRRPRRLK
jgi:hypothetical protein